MVRLGKLLVSKYREQLEADDTVSTGNLRDSFRYKITGFDTNIIGLELLAAKYAKAIDEGKEPGSRKPGIRPIVEWMKAKGIKPNKGTSAKDYKSAASSIASFIQENGTIKRFGYQGTNFLSIVASKYANPGVATILQAYEQDLKNEIDQAIKQNNNVG